MALWSPAPPSLHHSPAQARWHQRASYRRTRPSFRAGEQPRPAGGQGGIAWVTRGRLSPKHVCKYYQSLTYRCTCGVSLLRRYCDLSEMVGQGTCRGRKVRQWRTPVSNGTCRKDAGERGGGEWKGEVKGGGERGRGKGEGKGGGGEWKGGSERGRGKGELVEGAFNPDGVQIISTGRKAHWGRKERVGHISGHLRWIVLAPRSHIMEACAMLRATPRHATLRAPGLLLGAAGGSVSSPSRAHSGTILPISKRWHYH